jgi:pseudaminic acid biosynthesis-associated methylase
MNYKTTQEDFWAGNFGSDYIQRNIGKQLLASNLHFFATALRTVAQVNTCLELGANVGMNLRALALLYPNLDLHAVEINQEAAKQLCQMIPEQNVVCDSILNYQCERQFDLVITKGVLIHMDPEHLGDVYRTLENATRRYLLIAEYYNPSPVELPYRGYQSKLFKRDFAGEILENFPQFSLLDNGFAYRRSVNAPQDDINWFLLEKR